MKSVDNRQPDAQKRGHTGGGSTKSSLGKGSRMKTVKLVSPGSLLAPMLIVVDNGAMWSSALLALRFSRSRYQRLLHSGDANWSLVRSGRLIKLKDAPVTKKPSEDVAAEAILRDEEKESDAGRFVLSLAGKVRVYKPVELGQMAAPMESFRGTYVLPRHQAIRPRTVPKARDTSPSS